MSRNDAHLPTLAVHLKPIVCSWNEAKLLRNTRKISSLLPSTKTAPPFLVCRLCCIPCLTITTKTHIKPRPDTAFLSFGPQMHKIAELSLRSATRMSQRSYTVHQSLPYPACLGEPSNFICDCPASCIVHMAQTNLRRHRRSLVRQRQRLSLSFSRSSSYPYFTKAWKQNGTNAEERYWWPRRC